VRKRVRLLRLVKELRRDELAQGRRDVAELPEPDREGARTGLMWWFASCGLRMRWEVSLLELLDLGFLEADRVEGLPW
jgi:hypothetical protein